LYLTDVEFRQACASSLRVSLSRLDTDQLDIADRSHREAYGQIVGILQGRSTGKFLSRAAIDAWPRGKEYERDIGLFWWFTHTGLGQPFDQQTIARLDRRKELLTVSDVDPLSEDTGGVGSGTIDDSTAVFGHANYRRHVGPRHCGGWWGW
jgi:xanthine/CO dehydrogenase XdhC/CoxF family maturation factor